ncbi:MAG: DUF501 domain-containing protein [Micrococcaceae bacterium]
MTLKLTDVTKADIATIKTQLGREPRGLAGIAARCVCGKPLVVATSPRLPNGTPFPTTFYLTHPYITFLVSKLEASGMMKELTQQVNDNPELAAQYQKAHESYLAVRTEIGKLQQIPEVTEIKDFSAGGMPKRVKCLHALVGHSLAVGPGVNPIGDKVLELISTDWQANKCFCEQGGQDG